MIEFLAANYTSKGSYSIAVDCSAEDLAWNHMDLNHRPTVHNTYTDSKRIYMSENCVVSLTHFKVGPLKFKIIINDIQVSPYEYHQSYTVFNLFYIQGVLKVKDGGLSYMWNISSIRALAFIHPLLAFMIRKINVKQNFEDEKIRKDRTFLRSQGYRFVDENRNYITSNSEACRVIYPSLKEAVVFDLTAIALYSKSLISDGGLMFIVEKHKDKVLVWPKVCPHEGYVFALDEVCSKVLVCPLHLLQIRAVELSSETPVAKMGVYVLDLKADSLTVKTIENS